MLQHRVFSQIKTKIIQKKLKISNRKKVQSISPIPSKKFRSPYIQSNFLLESYSPILDTEENASYETALDSRLSSETSIQFREILKIPPKFCQICGDH